MCQKFAETFQIELNNYSKLVENIRANRAKSLSLSQYKEVMKWRATAHCLDLEKHEYRYLLSGCNDGSVAIFDLDTFGQTPKQRCKIIGSVKKTSSRSHKGLCSWVQWYPHDTGIFTTSSRDKSLKIWDTNAMKPAETFTFDSHVLQHHVSTAPSNACLVAVGTESNNVHLVDVNSCSQLQQLRGHKNAVVSVQWSPRDSNLLFTACQNGQIFMWDIRSARSCLHCLNDDPSIPTDRPDARFNGNLYVKAHNYPVNALKFTEDGLRLLSVDTEGFLKLWDYSTLKKVDKFAPEKRSGNLVVRSMGVDLACHGSDPANHVAYVPSEANVEAIDLNDGRSIGTLVGHYAVVNCCVYRKPFNELYSGGFDHTILVWQPKMDENLTYSQDQLHGANRVLPVDDWSDCN